MNIVGRRLSQEEKTETAVWSDRAERRRAALRLLLLIGEDVVPVVASPPTPSGAEPTNGWAVAVGVLHLNLRLRIRL